MATKHSPQIELVAARNALLTAREACPHWDFEAEGNHAECCYQVDDAKRRYRSAKRKAQ